MKTLLLALTAAFGLAGCGDFGPGDEIAGSELDRGTFGDATAINMAAQKRAGHPNARPLNGLYAQAVFDATIESAVPVTTVTQSATGEAEQ